jgi:hypothetical protein
VKINIFYIIILALALKVFYFVFALTVSKFDVGYQAKCNTGEFFSLFKRNDSFWYQKAAEEGYPKVTNPMDLGYSYGKHFKQSVWAHFPFYPLSIRAVETCLKLNFEQSAFVVSLIFSSASFIAFYLLCLNMFKLNERQSLLSTLSFMLFPFHYYYSMYYTEATFFTFLAFSFLSINKRKYWLTSILLIPLTLVRPNGIACLLPLFIYHIEVEGGFATFYASIKLFNWQKIKNVLWFLSAPLALAVYCIYQKYMTDHYFAFIKAQAGWYKEFMFPLLSLFRRGDLATQFNSVYTILFMLLAIVMAKKLPLSLNVLIWISMLLPMTSGSVSCMPRYISTIFPFSIYLASFFTNKKKGILILPVIFLLQLLTFYPWLIYHPFSF